MNGLTKFVLAAAASLAILSKVNAQTFDKMMQISHVDTTDETLKNLLTIYRKTLVEGMQLESAELHQKIVLNSNSSELAKELDKNYFHISQKSDDGIPEAMFLKSVCYIRGIGVVQNRYKSMEFLKASMKTGFRDAMLNYYYTNSDLAGSGQYSRTHGLETIERLANENVPGANYLLGRFLAKTDGNQIGSYLHNEKYTRENFFTQNHRSSQFRTKHLLKAVDNGSVSACELLSDHVDIDKQTRDRILGIGRKHSSVKCIMAMAKFHQEGFYDFEQDYGRALKFYEEAGALGSNNALLQMSRYSRATEFKFADHKHSKGPARPSPKDPSVKKNDKRAFNLALLVAGKGDCQAQCLVGLHLVDGIGCAPDPSRAFELFRSIADKYPEAHRYVSFCYERGVGTKKHEVFAGFHWRKYKDKDKRKPVDPYSAFTPSELEQMHLREFRRTEGLAPKTIN